MSNRRPVVVGEKGRRQDWVVPVNCAREFEVDRRTEVRKVWQEQSEGLKGEKKRSGRFIAAGPAESLQNGAGFSRKAWTHWTYRIENVTSVLQQKH